VGEAGQHADVRHLDLVEEEEAIVHGVVAKLGTDISNVNVVEGLVSLQVSDLNTEGGRAVRLAANHELSHHNGIVGSATKRTDPPFACCEMRGVDGESFVIGVPCSRGFQSAYVGTMAKLSLGVASNDLVVVGQSEPLFLLLGCTLLPECDLMISITCAKGFAERTYFEHAVVKTIRTRLTNQLRSGSEFLQVPIVLLLQDSQSLLPG
jgi:hypothetical protein